MFDNQLLIEKRKAQQKLYQEAQGDWQKYIELIHKIAQEVEESRNLTKHT